MNTWTDIFLRHLRFYLGINKSTLHPRRMPSIPELQDLHHTGCILYLGTLVEAIDLYAGGSRHHGEGAFSDPVWKFPTRRGMHPLTLVGPKDHLCSDYTIQSICPLSAVCALCVLFAASLILLRIWLDT